MIIIRSSLFSFVDNNQLIIISSGNIPVELVYVSSFWFYLIYMVILTSGMIKFGVYMNLIMHLMFFSIAPGLVNDASVLYKIFLYYVTL